MGHDAFYPCCANNSTRNILGGWLQIDKRHFWHFSKICYTFEVITKHFLRILILFTSMIFFGLVGVFLVSYFEDGLKTQDKADNARVAK